MPNLADIYHKKARELPRYFVIASIAMSFASQFIGHIVFRIIFLLVLLTTLILLIVDFQQSLFGKIHDLEDAVVNCKNDLEDAVVSSKDDIKDAISTLNPPQFKGYNAMSQHLQETLTRLNREDGISLKFIVVAMSHSWTMIYDNMDTLLKECPSGKKISIEIAMVDGSYLEEKRLDHWAQESKLKSSQIESFSKRYSREILEINVYHYKNLPHWHGILINDDILFLGRTDWKFNEDKDTPEFQVGEIEYRLFKRDDSVGGGERIAKFINWFKYYKMSANN